MHETDILLSRAAFSPREVARAGDLWRACQDLAVYDSSASGWPPKRYVDEGVSFIVRAMVLRHHRETPYGEVLRGSTWPSSFKRGLFFGRECRLHGDDGELVATATQSWVHVSAELTLVRASDALVNAFPVETHEPSVEMPASQAVSGMPVHTFELDCWHGWMDPLGHVNHPRYVDWADEGLARVAARAGLDPVRMRPMAESARFKSGTVAGDRVRIATRLVGRTSDGGLVCKHEMKVESRVVCVMTTVRTTLDGADPLFEALASEP